MFKFKRTKIDRKKKNEKMKLKEKKTEAEKKTRRNADGQALMGRPTCAPRVRALLAHALSGR